MTTKDWKSIPDDAVAIRPVRFRGDELVYYTPMRLKSISLEMHRLDIVGGEISKDVLIDLLDEFGCIVGDVSISKKQFEYLRGKLGFKVYKL